MLILVATNKSNWTHYWAGRTHAKGIMVLGHLWSPHPQYKITVYPHLPFAFDNGKYIADEQNRGWNPDLFAEHCDQILHLPRPPLWITVPDKRLDSRETLELWKEWEPRLRKYNVPLAFVLQDGIALEEIPESADVIFVGGSDQWRYPRLQSIIAAAGRRPVHVGRVNGNRIWQCHRNGVASVDGTGWMRGDPKQLAKLENYLRVQLDEAPVPHQDQLNFLTGQTEYLSYFVWNPHVSAEALISQTKDTAPPSTRRRIPDNITQEHLIQAMRHWRSFGTVPSRQKPQKYAVAWNDAIYPIKLLIARANTLANGVLLNTKLFSGGIKEANKFVEQRGLRVVALTA